MSTSEEMQEEVSRKRKFENEESSGEENETKRKLLALEPQLLDLADEILVEILLKLDGESLHNLALLVSLFKFSLIFLKKTFLNLYPDFWLSLLELAINSSC